MNMKSIILILILLTSCDLFSQHKVQIIGTDDSVNEYSVEEITDISFDLEYTTIAKVSYSDSMAEVRLNSDSDITFADKKIIFSGLNGIEEFALAEINSIEFEEEMLQNRYPFGELEVDEVIVDGLSNPWSLDFIDNDNIIFTEKDGKLYRHSISNEQTTGITGLPDVRPYGQGGLLDVTLHPNYDQNNMVYLAYTVSGNGGYTTAVGRGVLNGNMLENFEEIFRGSPLSEAGQHFGSRVVFDNENKVYFTIGDRGSQNTAQDSTMHNGGVLRINEDGSVPTDNPYLDAPGALPEIYTMGNRNIQGMFYLSEKDEIWAIEHGPRGGDELNLIEAGENYAWPLATFGINYNGTPITDKTSIPGYKDPITYWVPSIAPCGMELINYNEETDEMDILIATLAGSHLQRIIVKDYKVTQTVRSLEGYARFRDVQMSDDGYMYAATQSPGRIVRLKMKD
jgi:glucose/arabinose dehydrogenase